MEKFAPPEIANYEYTKDRIPLGVTHDGIVYFIDLKDASRIIYLGFTGCLTYDMKIRGVLKKLKNMKHGDEIKTKSYDFVNKKIVNSKGFFYKSGIKKVYKITLDDGRIIKASEEHPFFVKKDAKVIETKLSDLKIGDDLFDDKIFLKCELCNTVFEKKGHRERFCSHNCSSKNNWHIANKKNKIKWDNEGHHLKGIVLSEEHKCKIRDSTRIALSGSVMRKKISDNVKKAYINDPTMRERVASYGEKNGSYGKIYYPKIIRDARIINYEDGEKEWLKF
jgi:protein-arginine kinase activator protein McsA